MQGTYSKKMLVDLDMQNNEIIGFVPEKVSTLPTTNLVTGRIVVLTTDNQAYLCVGTSGVAQDDWVPLAKGGDLTLYQLMSEKDVQDGYAGLDSSGKIVIGEIPTGAIADGATSVVPTAGAVYDELELKQDVITAGAGLAFGTGAGQATLGHSNSVTAETTGKGSATAIPIIKYDAQGHITEVSEATVYPPTTAGTSGQYWKSSGDGAGTWQTPSAVLDGTSTTTVPSEKAVKDAIDSAVQGVYVIRGSATVAQINDAGQSGGVATPAVGDVYNVTDSGTITLGSVDVIAGDNVVYVQTASNPDAFAWDKLAGTVDTSNFVTLTGAQTVDGKTLTNVVSINTYAPAEALSMAVDKSSGSLTDDDAHVPTSKLVAQQVAGKMDKFATAPSQAGQIVTTTQSDADTIGFMTGDVGSGVTPIYIDDGVPTASTSTVGGKAKPIFLDGGEFKALGDASAVGGATQPIYLAQDGTLTAGTAIATAGYKDQDTGTISASSDDTTVPTSLTVYEALTGGVVTKVGTVDVGSASTPVYLNGGVPTAVTSIAKTLLPSGIGYIYTATITGDGTTKSWTLPLNSDVYTDPASVSIRDASGNEVGMHVQYTEVGNVKHVVISVNTAPSSASTFTVKIVA